MLNVPSISLSDYMFTARLNKQGIPISSNKSILSVQLTWFDVADIMEIVDG